MQHLMRHFSVVKKTNRRHTHANDAITKQYSTVAQRIAENDEFASARAQQCLTIL